MKLHVMLQDYENYGEPSMMGELGAGAIWKAKGTTDIFIVGDRVEGHEFDSLLKFLNDANILLNHEMFYQTVLDVEEVDDNFETDFHEYQLQEYGIARNTPTYHWNHW